MTRTIGFRVFRLLALCMLPLQAGSAPACDDCQFDVALDANGIGWRQIGLNARKAILSASAVLDLSLPDTADASIEWIDGNGVEGVQGELIEPGAQLVHLNYSSKWLSRKIDVDLWMNPEDGQILQYNQLETGYKKKLRASRYTNEGVIRRTWKPAENEPKLAWQNWSNQDAGFRAIQSEAHDAIFTDSLGVLYVLAASDLGRGSDRIDVLAFGSHEVSHIVMTAGPIVDVKTDFIAEGPAGEQRCKGKAKALKIGVEIKTVGPADEADSGFLSNIEVFLTPESRLPVLVSADAGWVGNVSIKMKRARMIDDRGCPAGSFKNRP